MKQIIGKSEENITEIKKQTHRVVKLKEMMNMEAKYK